MAALNLLVPANALAQDEGVEACFDAYEQTQVFLKSDDLVQAASTAAKCSSGCPDEIVAECKAWQGEAEREVPSVVLSARTERGTAAENVVIELDGNVLAVAPGEEVSLNPGPHSIRFSRDGWEEVIEIVAHKGEKSRQLKVVVPESPDTPVPPPEKNSALPWMVASYSLGAVGFGVAATGGIIGLDRKTALQACDMTCSQDEIDRLTRQGKTWLTVGDVGLIVGVAGVLGGTALLIWGTPSDQAASAQLSLVPTAGGGAALLSGRF